MSPSKRKNYYEKRRKRKVYRNIVDEENQDILYKMLDLKPHLNLDCDTLRGIEINVRTIFSAIGGKEQELKSCYFTINGLTYEVRNREVYLQGQKLDFKAYDSVCMDLIRCMGFMKGLREEGKKSHDIVRYTGSPGVFSVNHPMMPKEMIVKEED